MKNVMTLKRLFKSGQIKKFDWVSLPIIQKKKCAILPSRSGKLKVQYFSTGEITDMKLQLIGGSGKVLKFVGEALEDFPANFKGVKGRKAGPYELHRVCFELLSVLEHGIVACNITKSEYEKFPKSLQEQSNPYWIVSSCDSGELELQCVSSNGTIGSYLYYVYGYPYSRRCVIRPIYLISVDSKYIKVLSDEMHNGKSRNSAYKIILENNNLSFDKYSYRIESTVKEHITLDEMILMDKTKRNKVKSFLKICKGMG